MSSISSRTPRTSAAIVLIRPGRFPRHRRTSRAGGTFGVVIVLGKGGFDVTTATDGRTGLRLFHSARPDLVILHIGLPGLDGWSVLGSRIEAVRGFGYRYRDRPPA